MQIRLINLDRSPERLAQFNAVNPHLRTVLRFTAIDGQRVARDPLVQRGVIGPDLPYSDGALGNALSHFALWDEAIAQDRAVTPCEDDAIFNFDFERQAATLIASLGADWHMVYWGWNFDAVALFEMIPGVSPFLAQFDQEQMRGATGVFQSAAITPCAFRLRAAFGTVCYSVSPTGARLLKQLCLPLDDRPIIGPAGTHSFTHRDLSIVLMAVFPKINAYASFPPLVVTRNDHESSTVLPGRR